MCGSETTKELYDIDRSEPDPRLSEPPAEYQVLETKVFIEHAPRKFVLKKAKPQSAGSAAAAAEAASLQDPLSVQ